jgi:hypothetical protein
MLLGMQRIDVKLELKANQEIFENLRPKER